MRQLCPDAVEVAAAALAGSPGCRPSFACTICRVRPTVALDGVIARPVRGLSPSQLALAWRTGDERPLAHDYVRPCANGRTSSATP